jgi:Zn-finger nucleic acid-binding protein
MTYRDSFEKCPRCGVELVDARSARGCRACGGLWVEEPVLTEMIHEMLPPRPLGRLVLAVIDRTGAPIGCPTCGEAMDLTSIHEVVLDRCAKHGIWFDALELQTALQRVADPGRAPPLVDLDARRQVRPRPASPPPTPRPRFELSFLVETPGREPFEVRLHQEIVKIGRLRSSHVCIEGDDKVSRMHAVIEATSPAEVTLIDLGSAEGTFVNDQRVNKARLAAGDRIRMGATVIRPSILAAGS